jgi:tRNA 2-thiouridine synthesizing protein A
VSEPVVVDSRGRRCPQPVIDLARAARAAAPGALLAVLATDPAAQHDVPAWCRLRGHELVEIGEEPGPEPCWRIVVRLGQQPESGTRVT